MTNQTSPVSETPTNRQIHDAIANALSNGRTYSNIQEAVREIQKLYAGHAQTPSDTTRDLRALFQAIYDLIDDEDAAEPLDVAIAHAKKGLKIIAALSDTSTDRELLPLDAGLHNLAFPDSSPNSSTDRQNK
jgi:DNA-binding FadR family transcriptional regulator